MVSEQASKINTKIGILALQGDFAKHLEVASLISNNVFEIREAQELSQTQALIIPGGESSALLKLISKEFQKLLIEKIKDGMPTFSTCAGTILLAREVENPGQESLSLLSADVTRNAYGRQKNSWVEDKLKPSKSLSSYLDNNEEYMSEGVFIRAPKISSISDSVETLLSFSDDPVLVKEKNILAATFHPELSDNKRKLHICFGVFKKMIIDLNNC